MLRRDTYSGFTLIELTIVLLIIGLVTGGILVGTDLIESSKLRSQSSQFAQFNQSMNTFKLKYQALAGDFPNASIQLPSFSYHHNNGNGDEKITEYVNGGGENTTGFPYEVEPESVLFWIHLFAAELLSCCDPNKVTYGNRYVIGDAFPKDKINGRGISAVTLSGQNAFFWGINRSTTSGANAANYVRLSIQAEGVLTPLQAQQFDLKLDDGQPTTGNILTVWLYGGDNRVHPLTYHPASSCNANTTPISYNIAYMSTACSLMVKFQ